jgi:hypothetical protein
MKVITEIDDAKLAIIAAEKRFPETGDPFDISDKIGRYVDALYRSCLQAARDREVRAIGDDRATVDILPEKKEAMLAAIEKVSASAAPSPVEDLEP